MSEQQERKGKKYSFATIGARTERGGCVTTASSGLRLSGLEVACVGDIVSYGDGSEAVIRCGAGRASVLANKPAAIVGSVLSNGDRIISTVWDGKFAIFVEDGNPPAGFLDPDWVPPVVNEPPHRFAVSGSTTPRGGVLKDVTGDRDIDGINRTAGRIGDFIEYPDGTRARIITGIGIPGNTRYAYAVVGSMLDNGDVINDSPHRDVRTRTSFVPIDEHGVALTRQ